jgi:hypothetical protein
MLGDVIVAIDDEEVRSHDDYLSIMEDTNPATGRVTVRLGDTTRDRWTDRIAVSATSAPHAESQ